MAFFSRLKSLLAGSRVDVSKRFALLREAISGNDVQVLHGPRPPQRQDRGAEDSGHREDGRLRGPLQRAHKPPEGEIAMQLKHPRIVQTYEYGTTTDGAPYMVMEYLEGART